MESRADLKQAGHPSAQTYTTLRWICDSAQDFQKSALSCTVSADNPHYFPLTNLETNVPQSPKFFNFVALDKLPPTDHIGRLTGEAPCFSRYYVPQSAVFFIFGGPVAH